jgi:hypothetical protein
MRLIDTCEAIDQPFDGAKDTIGEGALTLEDAGQIEAQRLGADKNKHEEETDLKPAVGGH